MTESAHHLCRFCSLDTPQSVLGSYLWAVVYPRKRKGAPVAELGSSSVEEKLRLPLSDMLMLSPAVTWRSCIMLRGQEKIWRFIGKSQDVMQMMGFFEGVSRASALVELPDPVYHRILRPYSPRKVP